jgi:hypothetical protein
MHSFYKWLIKDGKLAALDTAIRRNNMYHATALNAPMSLPPEAA